MDYQVKIEIFEGPFDLLFHLIKQEKINIYDISIAQIIYQYLDYINKANKMDLELSSEFLLMASILLKIKSNMLLPKPTQAVEENIEDFREQLIERLVEYGIFKQITTLLRNKEKQQEEIYSRIVDNVSESLSKGSFLPGNLTMENLQNAIQTISMRKVLLEESLNKNHFIIKDKLSIHKKIIQLLNLVSENKKVTFSLLLKTCSNKSEVIVTLLALLEMVKIKKAIIIQEELFGEILIYDHEYYKSIY